VFSIEYLSLGKGFSTQATATGNSNSAASGTSYGTSVCNSQTPGYNSTYGFCITTQIPSAASLDEDAGTISGNYITNFFVEPNIKAISWGYSCWPNILGTAPGSTTATVASFPNPFGSISGLLGAEAVDIGQLTIPGISLISTLIGPIHDYVTGSPALVLLANCKPQAAINTFFAILDAYGIIGLVSFLIPLINIVITVSSIVGISGLLGGDTELAGLAKIL
jgi:hypothetical protein